MLLYIIQGLIKKWPDMVWWWILAYTLWQTGRFFGASTGLSDAVGGHEIRGKRCFSPFFSQLCTSWCFQDIQNPWKFPCRHTLRLVCNQPTSWNEGVAALTRTVHHRRSQANTWKRNVWTRKHVQTAVSKAAIYKCCIIIVSVSFAWVLRLRLEFTETVKNAHICVQGSAWHFYGTLFSEKKEEKETMKNSRLCELGWYLLTHNIDANSKELRQASVLLSGQLLAQSLNEVESNPKVHWTITQGWMRTSGTFIQLFLTPFNSKRISVLAWILCLCPTLYHIP